KSGARNSIRPLRVRITDHPGGPAGHGRVFSESGVAQEDATAFVARLLTSCAMADSVAPSPEHFAGCRKLDPSSRRLGALVGDFDLIDAYRSLHPKRPGFT
ncbi:unnamed protein product, partial [Lampetra fluviatilis]